MKPEKAEAEVERLQKGYDHWERLCEQARRDLRKAEAALALARPLLEAALEITPDDVDYLLSFCPHVPISIQELLARAIERKPGVPK